MTITKSSALIVATLLFTAATTTTGFMVSPGGFLSNIASPSLLGATGGITGMVSIGNVYPLCRAIPSTSPAPPYYNQVGLIATPSSGLPITVPLNWVLVNDCVVQATFKVGLNPGVYSVTITSCSEVRLAIAQPLGYGCADLPKTVIVESNAWTQVNIMISTGIY